MSNYIFPFLLIFVNLYNPFSIYLTLAVNILFSLLCIFSKEKLRYPGKLPTIVLFSLIVLGWTLFVSFLNNQYSRQVIGRNIRILLATFLIGIILANSRISSERFIGALSLVLLMHVVFVYVQLIFPDIKEPMARAFNYYRDIFKTSSVRCMGLAGSYEYAGVISVSSVILFAIKYRYLKRKRDLAFFLISFVSVLFISRTAMIIGLLYFSLFALMMIQGLKALTKTVLFCLFAALFILWIKTAFPIVVRSMNFLDNDDYGSSALLEENARYGASAEDIVRKHLVLPESKADVILGKGVELGNDSMEGSDFGYVKLVYSVGLIGIFIISLLYLTMLKFVHKHRDCSRDNYCKIAAVFFKYYIALLFIFNFKLLLLYSRGAHDLALLNFFVIEKNGCNN